MTAIVTGTQWTRKGQYNYAIYPAGQKMDAQPGQPIATVDMIVWWYEGSPTLAWPWPGDIDEAIHTLENYYRHLK